MRRIRSQRGTPRLAACVGVSLACASAIGCSAAVNGEDDPQAKSGDTRDPDFAAALVAPLVRRLTHDEYLYTLQDVLGIELDPEARRQLPQDRPTGGFVNVSAGQTTLPDHVRAYSSLAASIVQGPEFESFVAEHVACHELDASCASEVAAGLGQPLFRRPLAEGERESFGGLFLALAEEGASFEEAARGTGQAMLQAPQFLYRLEVERDEASTDLVRPVVGYEMASRLSYLLWASAPDAALYEAAEQGELDTAAGVARQVERMLGDRDKVKRVTDRFILDWARLESLPDEDGLRDDLIAATLAFYDDHLSSGRDLPALLTSPKVFLTPALAEREGVEFASSSSPDMMAVELEEQNRLGLLAQPGVLAGMTNADGGAIVARGLFLRKQLFCADIPSPPASAQEAIEEFVEEQPESSSDRQIAEARLARAECRNCHSLFDPLAFGFEHFDFRGAYRQMDEHGNVLRSDGWVPTIEDAEYENLLDYMQLLAGSAAVQACLVTRQLEYALGSQLDEEHGAWIEALRKGAEARAHQDWLVELTQHDLFRTMPLVKEAL